MGKRKRKSAQKKGGVKRKRSNEENLEGSNSQSQQTTNESLDNVGNSRTLNSVNLVTPAEDQLFTFPYTTLRNPQGPNQFYTKSNGDNSTRDYNSLGPLELPINSSAPDHSHEDPQSSKDVPVDILSVTLNSSMNDNVPENVESQSTSSTVVDVIDVDKLPDRPDSPIGDDVIEIEPPETSISSNQCSTHRRFVDLTDSEETTNESLSKKDVTDDCNSNKSDDLLNRLNMNSVSKPPGPVSSNVSCPICMDDTVQIASSNRKLMSTMCGHIFCDVCVKKTVETLGVCPTCRKKVRKKQLRQIFL